MRATTVGLRLAVGAALIVSVCAATTDDATNPVRPVFAAAAPEPLADIQTLPPPIPPFPLDYEEPPPPETQTERIVALVQATWPEDAERATRILYCESRAGEAPATFDVTAANGGPMQLNRDVWEPYFEATEGWTWDQIVEDLEIHVQAAREVYDRAGGWWPWACY